MDSDYAIDRSVTCIPNWLIRQPCMEYKVKLCYGRLLWHADDNDEVRVSLKELGEGFGVSASLAGTCVRQLESHGLIRRYRKGKTNAYTFLDHDWMLERG